MSLYSLLVLWFLLSLPALLANMLCVIWHAYGSFLRATTYQIAHCPWCWGALHIGRWYPEPWSSTICEHHKRLQLESLAKRRAARLAPQQTSEAVTIPALPVYAEKVAEVCA